MNFAIYNAAGEIGRTIKINPTTNVDATIQAANQTQAGESYLQVDDTVQDDTHYIDTSTTTATPKTTHPATADKTTMSADGVDTVTISNIPDDTRVYLDGVDQGVIQASDNGTVEFQTDRVGKRRIVLRHVKHLDLELVINAA